MTKRIHSIDGGGIRGILPLALLVEIEARRGPCADLFDMVAGTSIGGIIATGVAHRVPAKTIYDTLVNDGRHHFREDSADPGAERGQSEI
jgi:uncharacterized protein